MKNKPIKQLNKPNVPEENRNQADEIQEPRGIYSSLLVFNIRINKIELENIQGGNINQIIWQFFTRVWPNVWKFILAQMLIGVLVGGYIQYYSMSTITTVVDVIKIPDPTEMCIAQIKNVSTIPTILNTSIAFLDVYHKQSDELAYSLLNCHGKYYYLIEGASKQGKSTFGQNLFNQLIQKPNVLALYIPLDEDNPKNIFEKINKCNWKNFALATESIQRQNLNVQIILIVDNIQHAFKKEEIAAGLMSKFKNMKTYHLNFLYISSQNSVISKMEYYILLNYY